MSDLHLVVNGAKYGGWKSIRVTRSIESICGSFSLEASDRWAGQGEPWPIVEEDECRVEIDGEVVIDGWVDVRSPSLDPNARTLTFEGRDRTSAMVDCSALIGGGTKWSFKDMDVAKLAKELCDPFGIRVTVQPGLVLTPRGKCTISPGDTAFAALDKIAKDTGVLLVSDAKGGLRLTRAGTTRIGTALVEGENIKSSSCRFDATQRFYRYVLLAQAGAGRWPELDGAGFPMSNEGAAKATAVIRAVRAEAIDEGVRRKERVLVIRPDTGMDTETARRRVDWEARVRAARAARPLITVHGWRQANGDLWPVNGLASVKAPAIGVDGDLLISQAVHTIDDGGEITQLSLMRPDAFLPEPRTATVRGEGRWKELDKVSR